LTSMYTNILG